MTQEASGQFSAISAAEAKEKLDAGVAQVVDVRSPGDWAGAHMSGALNLPLISVRSRKDEMAADKELIFVCGDGKRSPQACEVAVSLGFTKVYYIEGGTAAWTREGFPMESVG